MILKILMNKSVTNAAKTLSYLKANEYRVNLCFLNYQKRFFHISTSRFEQAKQEREQKSSSIIESVQFRSDQVSTHLSTGQKAKRAAADATNFMIILAGGAIVSAIFYYLFIELFSRETPSGIYDESSKICLENHDVQESLGHPIKVTAESGGRRVFQVKHKLYVENGEIYMILNYYLEGPKNRGTVYVKVKKNKDTQKFEYEHVIVKLDHYNVMGSNKIHVLHKEADKQIKSIF